MQSKGKKDTPHVVVIGSASVGKTSLINRIIENKYDPITSPTTGSAFFQYKSNNPNHPEIQLWDTAGMERYRSLNSIFYREAVAAVLVFDITKFTSFQELDDWLKEFITQAPPNPSIVIAANKNDLRDDAEVTPEDIQAYASQHQLDYFATSAFTGENVEEMIDCLLNKIPKVPSTVETTVIDVAEEPQKKCC